MGYVQECRNLAQQKVRQRAAILIDLVNALRLGAVDLL